MPVKEKERKKPINEGHNRSVYDSENPRVSPKDWPVKNPTKPPKK